MKHTDLVGISDGERDRILLAAHKEVFEYLQLHKEGKVEWKHFDAIQTYLMEATGYTKKEVTCPNKEVIVSFVEGMFMLDELVGKGKNELEAVCNACSNFVNDPYKYNSFSIKYVTQLKKEFPDLFK